MIIGIGIDSIEIERFTHWHTFSQKQLERIFSPKEIAYCLSNSTDRAQLNNANIYAQRFAARFAAREAFFKAIAQLQGSNPIPFLTLCRKIEVVRTQTGAPKLMVDWESIINFGHYTNINPNTGENNNRNNIQNMTEHPYACFISLTHTNTVATAFVIIEKLN